MSARSLDPFSVSIPVVISINLTILNTHIHWGLQIFSVQLRSSLNSKLIYSAAYSISGPIWGLHIPQNKLGDDPNDHPNDDHPNDDPPDHFSSAPSSVFLISVIGFSILKHSGQKPPSHPQLLFLLHTSSPQLETYWVYLQNTSKRTPFQ